jgi:hypothetical protein
MRDFEEQAKPWFVRSWAAVAGAVLLGLAVAIRLAAPHFQGWDYKDYFQRWLATLIETPGSSAFGQAAFSD